MADLSRMERALRNADAAGDIEAAKVIARALKEAMAQQQPEGPSALESAAGYVNKLAQSAAQGVTLGYMDEIGAGLDAPFVAGYRSLAEGKPFFSGIGQAYDDRLKAYRQDQADFRRDNPISAAVGEVGGAVAGTLAAPAALAGVAAKTGLPVAAKIANVVSAPFRSAPAGTSMLGQMGRGAAAGGTLGGLYGFGSGEGGLENRLTSAATGAAVGGVVGGAAPPVVEGVRKGGQWVADQTINRMPYRQAGAAERKVAEALSRDSMTPQQAAQRLQEMGPDAAVMDLGQNTRRLARGAHTVPGEGSAKIEAFVKARQEGVRNPATGVLEGGQVGRITQNLDDMVPQRALESLDDLTMQRMRAAGPLYDEAFAQKGLYSDRLKQFMDDPITKAGLKRGLEVQRLEAVAQGKPFNPKDAAIVDFNAAGDPIIGGVPNMRTYDAVKRGLDALIEGEKNQFGKLSERGRALNLFKKAFVNHLDTLNPDYATARAAYSGPSQLMDALSEGGKFLSKSEYPSPEAMAKAVSKMSPDEQHFFRVGAVQALRDKIGDSVVRADATKKLMGNNYMEQKIRAAFGDEAMFKRYVDMLKNEGDMFESYAKITGNSATAERLAEQADVGVDRGRVAQGVVNMVNPATGLRGLAQGAMDVAGGLKDRATITGPMSRNLGEIMTGRDIARLDQQLKTAGMNAAQRRARIQAIIAGGAVAGGRTAQGQ